MNTASVLPHPWPRAETHHGEPAGSGEVLDLEHLTDAHGRQLDAFGHRAGSADAALATRHWTGVLDRPLRPSMKDVPDTSLVSLSCPPRVLVIGAGGPCGRGSTACTTTGRT